jgi:cob(I)alamin adenosyltransferase
MDGYTQVYTGNGKGKTTAAFGLALRAAGAGLRVYIGQFAKSQAYSELKSFELFKEQIKIRQYGLGGFIRGKPSDEDIRAAQNGLQELRTEIRSGSWDVVILDEANIATSFKLFAVEDLLDMIDRKPKSVELVITGRNADPRVIERADLATEMKEIKHYYQKGLHARKGIEN